MIWRRFASVFYLLDFESNNIRSSVTRSHCIIEKHGCIKNRCIFPKDCLVRFHPMGTHRSGPTSDELVNLLTSKMLNFLVLWYFSDDLGIAASGVDLLFKSFWIYGTGKDRPSTWKIERRGQLKYFGRHFFLFWYFSILRLLNPLGKMILFR